jgi:hypothetical protein
MVAPKTRAARCGARVVLRCGAAERGPSERERRESCYEGPFGIHRTLLPEGAFGCDEKASIEGQRWFS